jgi:HEAT repeat protein/ribosomal protein S18 acetylase RimI-like enzyme
MVRRGTAESLSALAQTDPKLAAQLYEQGLKDKDPDVRRATARSLSALAPINPELYVNLYEQGLKDSHPDVRLATAESLSALAPINQELQELYVKLYEQGLKNDDLMVRRGTAESLSALAQTDPKLAAQLYEQGLKDKDPDVRRGTAKSLSALAPIQELQELCVKLYEQGLKDNDFGVRRATAESLSALAPINPELYAQLYEQCLKDSVWEVSWVAAQSLSALAPINPELYAKLYEQGLKDRNPAVRLVVAQSLSALAPINPELYAKLYEQGLKNSDPGVRSAIAESLSAFMKIKNTDFSKLAFIEPILQKHQISEDEKLFVYARINQLLHYNKDLGDIILDDIPSLRVIKEYARTINPQLPENKQTINPDAFFEQNQIRLAKLFEIDRDLAQKMIIQKIQQLGFPRLERTLTLVDTLSPDSISAISLLIRRTPEKDSVYLEKLLELSDAYHRMGLESKFLEIAQAFCQKESLISKNIIQEISSELLKELSKKLGIESKIAPEAINQWNLEYLSKLFFAERNFEEESRDLLKIIVKTTLQGDFQPIILNQDFDRSRYTRDELEIIDEIQKHNQKVKKVFQDAGIDYETWLSYPKTQEFNVGASPQEQEKRFKSFTKELSEVITNLLGSRKEGKPGILPQETAKKLWKSVFKKYGIKFQEDELVTDKGKLSPFDLQNPLEEIIKFLEKEMESNPKEALGTSLDHLRNLLKLLPDLQKETKQKGYQFQIKLWDRRPGYDIFQGNYTHCCIAVENFNRAAILDYLVDTGINIIEVKDMNTNQTIAQTFILMAENQEKEIIAILDNIEINNDYRGLADKIRQQLFTYISNFVDVLVKDPSKKINTVLLGTAFNDVETNDLPTRTEVVRKIGGPGIQGTQYLDSFGSAWVDPSQFTSKNFFVALDNLRSKDKSIEKPKIKRGGNIEIISQLDESILQDILSVEKASFPDQMQSNLEDLRKTLENPNGIQIVVRSQDKVIGYLSSKPQKEAYEELKNWDPEIDQEDQTLYVESIAIKPEARDLRTFLKLGRVFIEEAKKRGYKKITMHARVATGLSSILQKRYGAKALRKIENWHNFEEPFEYLEINLSE